MTFHGVHLNLTNWNEINTRKCSLAFFSRIKNSHLRQNSNYTVLRFLCECSDCYVLSCYCFSVVWSHSSSSFRYLFNSFTSSFVRWLCQELIILLITNIGVGNWVGIYWCQDENMERIVLWVWIRIMWSFPIVPSFVTDLWILAFISPPITLLQFVLS